MADFIEQVLSRMTIQEKVSLLAGSDMWHTMPVERLNIPALKMSDGPNGARGGEMSGGTTAACFPCGTLLAATWNTALIERVGQALGQEAKTKGAHMLLAPTVNIHRSPIGGRNFESFSEDPFLTARMAQAYITGVQSEGVSAMVKHYVCNESEFERNTMSSEVGERALREIYLPPFRAAVQQAHTWALMASYNFLNGVAVSENPYVLHTILRDGWGFDGLVVSDWFMSVKSTAASVNAGLDLEMPGPGLWRGQKLLQAVEDGEVTESTLDESVRRLLLLLERTGMFEHPQEEPEQAINRPEHRALIRETATEGIVLLKNEQNVLPLHRDDAYSLAVIGPNAKTAQIMGGGSAQVNPHYRVTPFEGIQAVVGEQVTLGYELGCPNFRQFPLLDVSELSTLDGQNGWGVEYFNDGVPHETPVFTEHRQTTELLWFGAPPEGVDARQFAVRATGRFVPQTTGTYVFSLVSAGFSRFLLDGNEVLDNWTHQTPGGSYFGMGSTELTYSVELHAGQTYNLTLEFGRNPSLLLAAVRLGCLPPQPDDMIERAASLAKRSDVALVFVGLNAEWESEGFDRVNMDLPGAQNALIEAVAAANPRTIVVINAGSPLTMPWLDKVAAVVYAWYPGQECGNAIADVLFGNVNPSGKLPQTFPLRLEDNPSYLNFPGENGKELYGEGIFVGYRYYETKKIAPLFPFGFGLSYTTFAYGTPRLSSQQMRAGETLEVSIDVSNTGQRQGQEIVQLYVRDPQSSLQRPEKELKAFAKVALNPGEHTTVTLPLTRESLAYFDDRAHQWVAEAGTFEVHIGSSSQDIRATATFELMETQRWL